VEVGTEESRDGCCMNEREIIDVLIDLQVLRFLKQLQKLRW
jgi:hypothetical protein